MQAKSAAIARRIAEPCAAHDAGSGEPASPPPVTHSWTNMESAVPSAMARSAFQVIPVLDLKAGRAVHAVAGRRDYYQPIHSILHATSEPAFLARAFGEILGLESLYLADLDAIGGLRPSVAIYRQIVSSGLHLIVDAGVRDVTSLGPLLELDGTRYTIVAGLETIRGPRELRGIVERAGPERVIFSLDLFDGRPRIAVPGAWRSELPRDLAREAIHHGASHILLLDLARVGTGRGVGMADLLARIRELHPAVRISVGGGISGIDEVRALRNDGAASVLVGSALHNGRIGLRELAALGAGDPG
jgi:phosphoribosylformimino-5-aminoimidazole carboxamide ribotide isomerase